MDRIAPTCAFFGLVLKSLIYVCVKLLEVSHRFSAKFSAEGPVTMVYVRLPSRHILNSAFVHTMGPDVAELFPV